ncbi:uncharacterized protein LOC142149754 isoform X1 [Mixophyes fleayi]|uniref:uncharacterized protein LOC142149754 isoform X1 n=1 Tax=Mixophyes fleayi TaxID=3061075 RepID=UPI003F4E2B56
MELLILLGVIGMEIVVMSSEYLPPPKLTLMTPGILHIGQSVELQCTAPTSYPECFFYLFSDSSGNILQRLQAAENRKSVSFTLHNFPTWGTMTYICKYQCRVTDQSQVSDVSDVLSLNILDEPGPTDASRNSATESVPVWVIALVGGFAGFVFLAASVYVTVYLVRRNNLKKQEQRDKESIWMDQNMAKDWCNGQQNQVFSLHSTSEIDLSHPEMGCKDSLAESGPVVPFSTFRT